MHVLQLLSTVIPLPSSIFHFPILFFDVVLAAAAATTTVVVFTPFLLVTVLAAVPLEAVIHLDDFSVDLMFTFRSETVSAL